MVRSKSEEWKFIGIIASFISCGKIVFLVGFIYYCAACLRTLLTHFFMFPLTSLKLFFRYVNYIGAAQLYLKDNFLLQEPLRAEHVKDRILGHWGTVPGLSFMYTHANYLITKHDANMLFIAGPGHGAPGVLACLFAEGTMGEFYKECSRDGKGMGHLIKSFSWPGGFPSHLNPGTPGSILEGGELGYSLSTAFGAVMDNPDLIAVCAVGDGEAETGPLAAAWQSNKFLSPATCGAVLPILHVNGYKISGPTIYGTMSDGEIQSVFQGFGYQVRIVEGEHLHRSMASAMEWAYQEIRAIQKKARALQKKGDTLLCPRWPMIVLRSTKGWTGIHELNGRKIEGNFPSHGIPLADPKTNPKSLKILEQWLRSYKIHELVDREGRPLPKVLKYVPKGDLRMGKNKHTYGGQMLKELKMPKLEQYQVKVRDRGGVNASNTHVGALLVRDIFKLNRSAANFRYFCPDETESNKMQAIFEETKRAFQWPLKSYDEQMDPYGRVIEMLSEHTLQGFLQGYVLTGRHGLFGTYEAFAPIISSMVDQYAKFLKQSQKVPFRKPLASLNYILTSLGWRQEHNGYSHQNPGFITTILEKHGSFCSVYLPCDANSLVAALDDSFRRKNSINVIAAGKQNMPQWMTMKEAREQIKTGIAVWDWAHPGSSDPDVVLAAAGDHMTLEMMAAVSLLKEHAPELRLRVVNVSELTALGMGDERRPCLLLNDATTDKYFTLDRDVVFNFHGYPSVIQQLTWGHPASLRFSIHGYLEEGTTTTPFDMHVRNRTSRYHLAIDAISRGAKFNPALRKRVGKLCEFFESILTKHQQFIVENGRDMDEVENWKWRN